MGSATAIPEAKLRVVRNNAVQWSGMSMQEMQESAEFVSARTIAEQTRVNEEPAIGGGTEFSA